LVVAQITANWLGDKVEHPQTCVLTDTPLNKQLLLEEKIVMTTGESQRAEYFGLRAVLRHVV